MRHTTDRSRAGAFRRPLSLLLTVGLFLSLCGVAAWAETTTVTEAVVCETASDEMLGEYVCVTTGLTPYVFVPTGAGVADASAYATVTEMVSQYGGREGIVAAVNGGIFYNTGTPIQYGFFNKQPDGVVIADGVVLRSVESIDHTECDILVIDEDGGIGWTDYWADADALAAGSGYYYDMYGDRVTGKRVVSALTGFVPILVAGEPVYDEDDELLHGYDNYVGHYTQSAARQIIGAREDGTVVLLSNLTGWTLARAAEAARAEGCVFAYSLDGGGSAETVISGEDGSPVTVRGQSRGERTMPTYIVFTDDDVPPESASPLYVTAWQSRPLSAGASLAEIAAALTVTEYLRNADGNLSSRVLHSAQAFGGGLLIHEVTDASGEIRKASVSPMGAPVYVKTPADTALSLRSNDNTRADGAYYDYSAGYTISVEGDLATAGEKRVVVSYVPGGGLDPLTADVAVTLS